MTNKIRKLTSAEKMATNLLDKSTGGRPKYRQVFDHLSGQIRSGHLAPGQPLPTEARLIESLGMSRTTIRQALAQLENDGVIERIRGRGTFVTTEQQRQAQQKNDIFALIAPTLEIGPYPALLHGFEQACGDCQHQTVVANSGNDVGRQADLIIQMVQRAVGGLALVPTTVPVTPQHQIKILQENQIPVVLCHRTVPGVVAPSVIYNGRAIGLAIGRELVALGHRRVALFACHKYSLTEAYLQGLMDAYLEKGMAPSVESVEFGTNLGTPDTEALKAVQTSLMHIKSQADPPTAIVCGNAPDAEIVYLQALAFGWKIPHDISLAYIGTTAPRHGLAGRLSGVAIHEREMGIRTVQLLHEMRAGKRPIDSDEQFECDISLLPGGTIGPAPKSHVGQITSNSL